MQAINDNGNFKAIPAATSTKVFENYTVVGSPTISSEYIASGFTKNDYLTQDLFNINYHHFEIVFKVYGYSTSHGNPLCSKNNSQSWLSRIVVNTNGTITVGLSNNNSSWNVCNFTTSGAIPNNTWLWIKIKWDGTAYVVSYSTDKETWTELGRATTGNYYGQNLSKLFSSNDTGSSGLKNGYGGQVDLKECYLSIDDMKAWQGAVIVNQQEYKGVNR